MPYYITEENPDCKGWAVMDVNGPEVFGCHLTKQAAIDQAVAIALNDGEEFIGENKRAEVDLSVPQFMRDAANQGLKYFADGLAGDGLTPKTVREARLMAAGEVSAEKWVRIAAWIARHMPDLDAPAANPNNEGYPSAGVVAHLLWGSGPSKDAALRAMKFAERKVSQIEANRSLRVAGGQKVIVSDIDDTLIRAGERVEKVWQFIQDAEGELFLVTGRPESRRDETVKLLRDNDITFSRLIMNPGSSADSIQYKKDTMEELLKTYDVTVAVENNTDVLRVYRDLGVESVNPTTIGDNRNMDVRAEINELTIGDYVRWIAGEDVMHGEVQVADGDRIEVQVYNEEDGVWSPTDLVALVPVALLEKVEPLVSAEPMSDAEPEDVMRSGGREREVRTSPGAIEVREGADGMTFEGYAAVFNSPSEPLPFIEKIERGAFQRSLKSRNDVKLLWNHDTSQVLGSTRAKTLTLIEDDRGLKVRGILPNTTAGRDAAELLKRGDVDSMSFGFSVIKDAWSSDGAERTLKAVRLHEVSIVAFPAYSGTAGTTSVRKLDKVAQRAEVDADALSAALMKIEAGDDITTSDRDLLSTVISKLAPETELPVSGDMLALKKKKLELLKGAS